MKAEVVKQGFDKSVIISSSLNNLKNKYMSISWKLFLWIWNIVVKESTVVSKESIINTKFNKLNTKIINLEKKVPDSYILIQANQ